MDVAITPVVHIYSQFFVHSLAASPRPRTRFDRQSSDQFHSVVFSGCMEKPSSNFLFPTSCIPGSGNFSKVECLSFSLRHGLNFLGFHSSWCLSILLPFLLLAKDRLWSKRVSRVFSHILVASTFIV